jgi:predicted RNA-binding protein YlqC (UPF0109 family)
MPPNTSLSVVFLPGPTLTAALTSSQIFDEVLLTLSSFIGSIIDANKMSSTCRHKFSEILHEQINLRHISAPSVEIQRIVNSMSVTVNFNTVILELSDDTFSSVVKLLEDVVCGKCHREVQKRELRSHECDLNIVTDVLSELREITHMMNPAVDMSYPVRALEAPRADDEDAPLDPQSLLEEMAMAVVDFPSKVRVESKRGEGNKLTLVVHADSSDYCKIVGKQGRTVLAIRTYLSVVAAKAGLFVSVVMANEVNKPRIPKAVTGKTEVRRPSFTKNSV